jgi:hypothetical protein
MTSLEGLFCHIDDFGVAKWRDEKGFLGTNLLAKDSIV